jgi:hypothetical protein
MPVFVDNLTLASMKGTNFDPFIQELSSHFKLCDLGPTTQACFVISEGHIGLQDCLQAF